MLQVSLDTSFLITFADPERPNHSVAVDYFRHCLVHRIPMWLSAIAAGEFEVKQPVSDLPLQNFRVQPYNLPHAIRAAALFRALRDDNSSPIEERRSIIINDLKILAQAEEEEIPVILTEDRNTLSKLTDKLRLNGQVKVRVLLLADGFKPGRLATPDQDEFSLPPFQ
jgi:predicted nucleic acid-binding protein